MSELCGCNAKSAYILSQKTGCPRLSGFDQATIDARQRIIQGVVGASSGEYLMNKRVAHAYGKDGSKLDNGSAPIQKNDSYARYLAKKTGKGVLREEQNRAPVAIFGGKVKRFGMFGYCSC